MKGKHHTIPRIQKAVFSPYFAACDLGAVGFTSGINWSHAIFESQEQQEKFVKLCNENGYRTRQVDRLV